MSEKMEWIYCSERLPHKTMLCLCVVESKNKFQKQLPILDWWISEADGQLDLFHKAKGRWKNGIFNVVKWMPCPLPEETSAGEAAGSRG